MLFSTKTHGKHCKLCKAEKCFCTTLVANKHAACTWRQFGYKAADWQAHLKSRADHASPPLPAQHGSSSTVIFAKSCCSFPTSKEKKCVLFCTTQTTFESGLRNYDLYVYINNSTSNNKSEVSRLV